MISCMLNSFSVNKTIYFHRLLFLPYHGGCVLSVDEHSFPLLHPPALLSSKPWSKIELALNLGYVATGCVPLMFLEVRVINW